MEEKCTAIASLVFMTEKMDSTIKDGTCTDGWKQPAYIPEEETASMSY